MIRLVVGFLCLGVGLNWMGQDSVVVGPWDYGFVGLEKHEWAGP